MREKDKTIESFKKIKKYLTHHFRLAWRYYSEARRECLKAKLCVKCNKKAKQIYADHVNPVVDVNTGFVDWNTYAERMFSNDLQPLCRACHASKSKAEAAERRAKRDHKN